MDMAASKENSVPAAGASDRGTPTGYEPTRATTEGLYSRGPQHHSHVAHHQAEDSSRFMSTSATWLMNDSQCSASKMVLHPTASSAAATRDSSPLIPCRQEQHSFVSRGQPSAMARRNERERKRVRMVNHGFATLRQYLPQGTGRKKLSKMETLRSAIEYIRQLQDSLDQPCSTFNLAATDVACPDVRWTLTPTFNGNYGGSQSVSWEDTVGWATPRSPGSAGSSPHTSLSPEVEIIDFSTFS